MGGRRVAASAPVLDRTLSMLRDIDARRPSVPTGRDRPGPAARRAADETWVTDTFSIVLDRRPPGALIDGDPWLARGRAALWSYRMVDPRVVRAAWWADAPLLGRRLAQEGRFGPLRLRMATEVVAVVDAEVEVDGAVADVAGFEYRTLEGHLEDGWQSWQLWRWRDTGVLEHRGHTIARRGRIADPVVRFGMHVFGRAMQLLAGRLSAARLTAFVDGEPGGTSAAASTAPVRSLATVPGAVLLDGDATELVTHPAQAAVDPDQVQL